jgi:tripartite-type tricarboxylate transporter receptor subunit TctC
VPRGALWLARKSIRWLISALIFAAPCVNAYPNKPITLVVPFAAGGPSDKLARDLAEGLRKYLPGASFLIDNTPGAGGTNGIGKVAHATNDGYTLLITHINIATTPWLYKNLKYKARDDFEYLGLITEVPMTLIGRPGLPSRDFTELTQWIHTHKRRVNMAHAGPGSASYLCGLLFQQGLGVELTAIHFSGTGPAMAAMLSEQVDLMCDQATNTVSQIESGTIKAFGITTDQRITSSPTLAKLPTLDESGLTGFKITIWHGLYAPKGTPKVITDRLSSALKSVLADPAFIKTHAAVGAVSIRDNRSESAQHKRFVEAETIRWGRVIKNSGQFYTD